MLNKLAAKLLRKGHVEEAKMLLALQPHEVMDESKMGTMFDSIIEAIENIVESDRFNTQAEYTYLMTRLEEYAQTQKAATQGSSTRLDQ